jgi:hypothetical protein
MYLNIVTLCRIVYMTRLLAMDPLRQAAKEQTWTQFTVYKRLIMVVNDRNMHQNIILINLFYRQYESVSLSV